MNRTRVTLVAVIFLLGLAPVRPQTETPQERFQITLLDGAKFSLKNLNNKSLTACVLQLSSSSETKPQGKTQWDSLVQNVPPIAPGESMAQFLGHAVGGPIPDKVEVLAGVWEDGETFGEPAWVKRILGARQLQANAYGLAITLLRQGAEQNWTLEQYKQALSDKPNSLPFVSLKSTLGANEGFSQRPSSLRHVMQIMLDSFTRRYEEFQRSKPTIENLQPI
jgi:hypothetical protein